MSIAGLGSLASLGSQYDFTSMSNSQLLDAAHNLASQGEISTSDESQLVAIASGVDSCSVSGTNPSVNEVLQDPTQKNFIDQLNEQLAWDQSNNSTSAASLDKTLLADLNHYQTDDTLRTAQTISVQA